MLSAFHMPCSGSTAKKIVVGTLPHHHLRRRVRRPLLLLPPPALTRSKRRQRQQQRKVEVGERAQTIGGFVGTVVQNEIRSDDPAHRRGRRTGLHPQAIAKRYDPPVPFPSRRDDDARRADGRRRRSNAPTGRLATITRRQPRSHDRHRLRVAGRHVVGLGWGPKLGLDLAGGLSVVYKPADPRHARRTCKRSSPS